MKLHCIGKYAGWPLAGTAAAASLVLLLASPAFSQGASPVVSCESLSKLVLQDTVISSVQQYTAGEYKAPLPRFGVPDGPPPGAPQGAPGGAPTATPPGGFGDGLRAAAPAGGPGGPGGGPGGGSLLLSSMGYINGPIPAFCRVVAVAKPTPDSNIRIDVVLPVSGWNGKMIAVGGGGGIGDIGGLSGFARGYAFANASDAGPSLEVASNPNKLIDFSYRTVHVMTVHAKEIIKAYYGSEPKHAYWFGHSAGGYQGLQEAAHYPKDYDGIGIGWPPNPAALFNATQLWPDWWIAHNPAMLIPHEKYPMIHQAVLDLCDARDGVKDGIITEPQYCKFQPKSLLCKGEDGPNCLTAPQVELLEKIYQGPTNPRTGEVYYPGPAPGEELEELWSFASGGGRPVGQNVFKNFLYKDANWDWKTVNWDGDVEKSLAVSRVYAVLPEDLKEFGPSGTKMLLYIGWANYHNPAQLIDFYKDSVKVMGEANAAKNFRFITMPGVFQPNPPLFNVLDAVENWVEKGIVPEQLVGTYTDQSGKPIRTRPLCAYPKVPTYKGTGDTDKAENFTCAASKFEKK